MMTGALLLFGLVELEMNFLIGYLTTDRSGKLGVREELIPLIYKSRRAGKSLSAELRKAYNKWMEMNLQE